MQSAFFIEEPIEMERTGPFALISKNHAVFWNLQEKDGVVTLSQYDDYHFKPDYSLTDDIRKLWVYEFKADEFLDIATSDRSLSISDFFTQANNFTKNEWRVLAAKAETIPKLAKFNIKRVQGDYDMDPLGNPILDKGA